MNLDYSIPKFRLIFDGSPLAFTSDKPSLLFTRFFTTLKFYGFDYDFTMVKITKSARYFKS